MDTKVCKKCGHAKPVTAFYKSIGGKFGVKSICKGCYHFHNKLYFELQKDKDPNKKPLKRYSEQEYVRVVQLLSDGLAQKQISAEMKIPQSAVEKILKKMRISYDCPSNESLIKQALLANVII
jgi:DNA-binding NarL/FixJ family response regulator